MCKNVQKEERLSDPAAGLHLASGPVCTERGEWRREMEGGKDG